LIDEKEKKTYVSPTVTSLRIEEPLAYACTVYNMKTGRGTWVGSNLFGSPTVNC